VIAHPMSYLPLYSCTRFRPLTVGRLLYSNLGSWGFWGNPVGFVFSFSFGVWYEVIHWPLFHTQMEVTCPTVGPGLFFEKSPFGPGRKEAIPVELYAPVAGRCFALAPAVSSAPGIHGGDNRRFTRGHA